MASEDTRTILGGSKSYRASCLIGSDELVDFSCTPCTNRNNTTVTADFYCTVCDELCCESCLHVHNSFKANNIHLIYGRDKLEYWGQQSRISISLSPTEECPDHPGEWLKMICLNHTVLCCSECVVHNHRTCPDMNYLPKIAKGIKESQDMSNVDHTIDQFIKFAEEMIESGKKTQTKNEKSKTDILDTITSMRKQAHDFFNTLEENATTEMAKCNADTKTSLDQQLKDLNDTKDNLTKLQITIQPSSTNNEAQLFIRMFMAQQKLPEIQKKLQKMAKTSQTNTFILTMDPSLQETFSTVKSHVKIEAEITTIQRPLPNLKPLPLLQLIQSPSPSPPTLPPKQTRQTETPASPSASSVVTASTYVSSSSTLKKKKTKLYTASNGRRVNIKLPSDDAMFCSIEGSCQMPDGDILLADWNNYKVKRLRNYEHTDYLKLSAKPRDVCCIDDEQAVVTDDNKTMNFLSITRCKMSVTRYIKVDHLCNGIAHHNGRLFVSTLRTHVYIYTTPGSCLKTIYKDNNGLNLFSVARRIGVSPDGSKIYVSDRDKGLVTLDNEGNHLSTYSSGNLGQAYGVCVDSQGRVLVCGSNSQNILQLERDGHYEEGVVISGRDRIKNPRSLCIDHHNSRIIVSKATLITGSSYIVAYDLKLVG